MNTPTTTLTSRIIFTLLAAAAMVALTAGAASAAVGVVGDPALYSSDPADFAHLSVQDFEAHDGYSFDTNETWELDGLVYSVMSGWTGGWVTPGWSIPGLDGAYLGYTNHFLAHDGDRVITPLVHGDQIAFRYGTQGSEVRVTVTLSDGTAQKYTLTGNPDDASWGTYGYFGFMTPDPTILIEQVIVSNPDGGIDDVSFGMSYVEPPTPEGPTCSLEGLATAIEQTTLEAGLEQRLEKKIAQVVSWGAQGETDKVIRGLEFIVFHLELERGDKVSEADADALLSCLYAMLGR